MKIALDELLAVMRILDEHLQHTQAAEIDIEDDYYWSVPPSSRYDPSVQPSSLSLGQLSDDWFELRKLLDKKRQPNKIDLVWLASLLRRLGE